MLRIGYFSVRLCFFQAKAGSDILIYDEEYHLFLFIFLFEEYFVWALPQSNLALKTKRKTIIAKFFPSTSKTNRLRAKLL